MSGVRAVFGTRARTPMPPLPQAQASSRRAVASRPMVDAQVAEEEEYEEEEDQREPAVPRDGAGSSRDEMREPRTPTTPRQRPAAVVAPTNAADADGERRVAEAKSDMRGRLFLAMTCTLVLAYLLYPAFMHTHTPHTLAGHTPQPSPAIIDTAEISTTPIETSAADEALSNKLEVNHDTPPTLSHILNAFTMTSTMPDSSSSITTNANGEEMATGTIGKVVKSALVPDKSIAMLTEAVKSKRMTPSPIAAADALRRVTDGLNELDSSYNECVQRWEKYAGLKPMSVTESSMSAMETESWVNEAVMDARAKADAVTKAMSDTDLRHVNHQGRLALERKTRSVSQMIGHLSQLVEMTQDSHDASSQADGLE